MSKIFETRAAKTPRSAPNDPAFVAAASAVAELGLRARAVSERPTDAALPAAGESSPLEATSSSAPAGDAGAQTIARETVTPPHPPASEVAATATPLAISTPASVDGLASIEPLDPRDAKVTIYPAERELRHLRDLAVHGRVAKSIITEYALEVLFQTQNDEQIVGELRARGHGLRKKRPTYGSKP